MNTEKEFNQETKRLGTWSNPSVALEDAQPFEGTVYYWDMAMFALKNSAALRILEAGLNPKDFGLDY